MDENTTEETHQPGTSPDQSRAKTDTSTGGVEQSTRRRAILALLGLGGFSLLSRPSEANHEGDHWQGDADADGHRLSNLLALEMINDPRIGTTDGSPLEIHLSGERAIRLEPTESGAAPNIISGTQSNNVGDDVEGATIAGGGHAGSPYPAPNRVRADYGTIMGGADNTASGVQAAVGGGIRNTASGYNTFIGGGSDNTASNDAATIDGGRNNSARGRLSTISGGSDNITSAKWSTVAGGKDNTANGAQATVGGGSNNTASGATATVSGGHDNTATDASTTVSGGEKNTANGTHATVPGGRNNTADGNYSLAAGRLADTNGHDGAFVLGDSTSSTIRAENDDVVRSQMPIYAPSFGYTSTQSQKSSIRSVDPDRMLAAIESLQIRTWTFDQQDDGRHIGPMAEEFASRFGLGDDTETIAAVDADGVAFAAIQGLAARLDAKDDRIDNLEQELEAKTERLAEIEADNAALREQLETLADRLEALENTVNGGAQD